MLVGEGRIPWLARRRWSGGVVGYRQLPLAPGQQRQKVGGGDGGGRWSGDGWPVVGVASAEEGGGDRGLVVGGLVQFGVGAGLSSFVVLAE